MSIIRTTSPGHGCRACRHRVCEDHRMVAGALSAAAAMLLIVAGVAKLRVPRPAAAMLLALLPPLRSMRRARLLARTLGLVEVAIGLSALLLGDRVAYGV